jgi:hypothetical protein
MRHALPFDGSSAHVRADVLAACFSNLGAAVADRLMLARWGWSITRTRKAINLAAQLGPSIALATLALTASTGHRHHDAVNTTSAALGNGLNATLAASAHGGAEQVAAWEGGGGEGGRPSPGALISTVLAAASIALGALTQAGCWTNMMDVA